MQTAPVCSSFKSALAILSGLALGLAAAACFPVPPSDDPAAPPESREPGEAETAENGPAGDESSETAIAPESSPEGPPEAAAGSSALPTVDTFTTEELFAAEAGGCGMSLWRADEDPRETGFLLFNGLDGMAVMALGGELVALERNDFTGEEFYGQYLSQTFAAPDNSFTATATVVLGEPGEIESVAIPAGTLVIQAGEAVTEIPVEGDAGC